MRNYAGLLQSAMADGPNIKAKNAGDMLKLAQNYAARLSTQDIIGITIFIALLPVGFLYSIAFPLSFLCELFSTEWFFRVVPLFVLGANVYLNAGTMLKVGPNMKGCILPSVIKPGYQYCHFCQQNAPPRSFHCPVCNFCVFRRDHHCSFVGCCVGHFNQRYFIAAVVSLWPIAFVCCTWNWHVLLLTFSPISASDLLKWVFPHVAFVLRFISPFQFFVILAFAFSLITFLFTTYLITAQLFCFWRGQTRVEYLMNVHAYNLSFRENIRQGLGSRWPLAFLSPFIHCPLESDGTFFRAKEREDIGKSTKYF